MQGSLEPGWMQGKRICNAWHGGVRHTHGGRTRRCLASPDAQAEVVMLHTVGKMQRREEIRRLALRP